MSLLNFSYILVCGIHRGSSFNLLHDSAWICGWCSWSEMAAQTVLTNDSFNASSYGLLRQFQFHNNYHSKALQSFYWHGFEFRWDFYFSKCSISSWLHWIVERFVQDNTGQPGPYIGGGSFPSEILKVRFFMRASEVTEIFWRNRRNFPTT